MYLKISIYTTLFILIGGMIFLIALKFNLIETGVNQKYKTNQEIEEISSFSSSDNSDNIEKQIISAHYINALTYIEERNYTLALNELDKIPINIDFNQLKDNYREYIKIYKVLGNISEEKKYKQKLLDLEKAEKLNQLERKHYDT